MKTHTATFFNMAKGSLALLLFATAVVGQALTPSTYFTNVDRERMKGVFSSVRPYGDNLEAVHYSILGFTLLEELMNEPQKACFAVKTNVNDKDIDSLFYASSVAHNLKNFKTDCTITVGAAQTTVNEALNGESTFTIYRAIATAAQLGLKVEEAKVTEALDKALKADDSPQSYAFAFYAASYLTGDKKKYVDAIEDVIAQADEVDETFLQFEGGLYTTAVVVDSAYKLAGAAKQAPQIAEDKVIKFANYFLSRKHVQSIKNAATVVSAVKTLTNNDFHIPIAVSLASQVSVSDKYPIVQVRVSNLLGKSLGKVTVTADTARHVGDDAVVLSKKPFTSSSGDNSLYELDFLQVKPARGFYKISVSATPQKADKRLLGTSGAEVEVKVTTLVAVENVELGVADKEQSTAPRTTNGSVVEEGETESGQDSVVTTTSPVIPLITIGLQHPNKAANVVEADHHQRITMKFQLRDKTLGKPMTAHQTFIRLTSTKTKQEIIFVAEADASSTYKFDLDVGAKAKDFGHMSGKYSMDLIVGDAVIQNPFSWTLADVKLSFPEASAGSKLDENRYSKKPEIKHIFREPDSRPPKAVSSVFSVLVLLPLAVLLILWVKIGVNIGNFSFSLSAIGFHLGLCAIFGLYYMYWVQLSMFTTLRYLSLLGIPTFFFGHRLLSGIAARRKEK